MHDLIYCGIEIPGYTEKVKKGEKRMSELPRCSQFQCPMNFAVSCQFYADQSGVNDSVNCATSMGKEINEGVLVGEML